MSLESSHNLLGGGADVLLWGEGGEFRGEFRSIIVFFNSKALVFWQMFQKYSRLIDSTDMTNPTTVDFQNQCAILLTLIEDFFFF
jgi:hypothetical protein